MEDRILKLLDQSPLSFQLIAQKLNVSTFLENKRLNSVLRELETNNKIFYSKNLYHKEFSEVKIGKFIWVSDIFSFVKYEDEKILIGSRFYRGAFEGDKVKFITFRKIEGKKSAGRILRVVQRSGKKYISKLSGFKNKINIFNLKGDNFYLLNINSGYQNYDEVSYVRFVKFVENTYYFESIEKKIIGNDIDLDIIMDTFSLENNFPDKVLNEAKLLSGIPKDNERKDLRNNLTYTIDGDDAKDFDDAIEINKKGENYLLKVHIADVASYIQENSEIDKEAYKRSNSVYFPKLVIPMLPEKLSNDLCSLKSNVDRNVITIELEIDLEGNILYYYIYKSLINSKYRLTYSEVEDFLLDGKESKNIQGKELKDNLIVARELSNILRKRNIRNKYIDFSLKKISMVLNSKNDLGNYFVENQKLSENIIENFMLLANEFVADFFINRNEETIFRIHAKPSANTLNEIKDEFSKFGLLKDNLKNNIFDYINEINNTNKEIYVRELIKKLGRAKYSNERIGHFSTGKEHYLHFTSPIRRYADLIVHRRLYETLFNKESSNVNLEKISNHISENEKKSNLMQWKYQDLKVLKYFHRKKLDDFYEALIVDIKEEKIFVAIEKLLNYVGYFQIPSNSRKKYRIGSGIKVRIKNIDWFNMKIKVEDYENNFKK